MAGGGNGGDERSACHVFDYKYNISNWRTSEYPYCYGKINWISDHILYDKIIN